MIIVENIYKSFGEENVLENISVEFNRGKTNLIIGRSGSGKTVLMKSIIGLVEINSGKILYDGEDFVSMNVYEKQNLRKEMGMLFQGAALFDSLTVEENVKFPLDMFSKMSNKKKISRTNFCLERVDLENVNNMYPDELSGGMKKRVAIARAIVQNPKYLFCDEPNSGLDPQTALVIDNLISEITHEFNITTIVNTHDMNSVMEIGEKIVFIHQGKKGWEGTKEEIFKTEDKNLDDFIFATNYAKKVKEIANEN